MSSNTDEYKNVTDYAAKSIPILQEAFQQLIVNK